QMADADKHKAGISTLVSALPSLGVVLPISVVCGLLTTALYWSMLLTSGEESFFLTRWRLNTETGVIGLIGLFAGLWCASGAIGHLFDGEHPVIRQDRYVLVKHMVETQELTLEEYRQRMLQENELMGNGITRGLLAFCAIQTLGTAALTVWKQQEE